MLDILLDALIDTLKLIPFLLLAYLLIEYIEHRASDRLVALLSRFGRLSPAAGALTGVVPQCGFSVTAAKLYSGRIITYGTLAAVFIATSDEALPILLSTRHYDVIWKLLLIKFVVATAAGFVIDTLAKPRTATETHSEAHHDMHEHCGHDECQHGIFKPALKHTATSALYIFIVILAMGVLVWVVGEDTIAALFQSSLLLQPLLAALLGFVPNCASSILLTSLYTSGALTFGALVAGLITNAGIGWAVLLRSKHDLKQNLLLGGILLLLGLLCGYVLQLFSI